MFDGYFFEKNLQGDIVAVYNQNGVKVAGYAYDAWGNCTTAYYNGGASTAAQYNPFRYRGYYYDVETGYYYLQSRYYDPEMGRFINADGYISTGHGLLGHNMFAYCFNNPLMLYDPAGDFPWAIIAKVVVTAIVVAIVALVTYEVITSESNDQTFATEDDALNDWANKYGPQSQDRERGTMVYQITDKEGTISYTYGRTYKGFSNNTIPGFVIGYISGGISALLDPNKKMIGFIHSHPDVAAGYHNDFPSNPDLFLLNLPGISEVYVVPYTKCSGVPSIIAGSQKSTWIH